MNVSLTRRQLLLTTAGLAGIAAAGSASPLRAATAVTTDQFLRLSTALTGVADLDAGVAATLLRGLLATGQGTTLAALVAGANDSPARALANEIVAEWYSGLYDDGKAQAVATFDQALLWNALSFTKPFGSCGGAPGYWADPPEG